MLIYLILRNRDQVSYSFYNYYHLLLFAFHRICSMSYDQNNDLSISYYFRKYTSYFLL